MVDDVRRAPLACRSPRFPRDRDGRCGSNFADEGAPGRMQDFVAENLFVVIILLLEMSISRRFQPVVLERIYARIEHK